MNMKTLIVMRHGHAENWSTTDFDRKLTAEGLEAVNAAAVNLRAEGLYPDQVWCSSAVRTLQTARRAAAILDVSDENIIPLRAFYHIDDCELLREIQHCADGISTLMVVGHNPAVSALVSGIGGEMRCLRPAGMAVLRDIANSWQMFGAGIESVRYC